MNDDSTKTHDDPLDALIADYIQRVEAGDVPDREALLATHVQHAERLRAFFADYDRLDRQAGNLRLSADPNLTIDRPEQDGELPRVRYFGDYELLEVIARGGMGVVYKARQVSLNRLVALKMLLAGELATERDAARFQAEAEAAAALDHSHIVPIYEVGVHEGRQYFSMKYVEGGSLSKQPNGAPRAEAERVAVIARAVQFAHLHGVLHRDLKPGNILIDAHGTPFVADFGLAKRTDSDRSLSESGAVVGTPRYMAPEQAAGRKDLTVATDIYSLGVILYERLTGSTPFVGDNALDMLRQLRESDPPRPSSIRPGLSRDLETIVLKCLEKEPAKRFASAEALADDLDRWLRGEPIEARPVGRLERTRMWMGRHPQLVAATFVAFSLPLAFMWITGQWNFWVCLLAYVIMPQHFIMNVIQDVRARERGRPPWRRWPPRMGDDAATQVSPWGEPDSRRFSAAVFLGSVVGSLWPDASLLALKWLGVEVSLEFSDWRHLVIMFVGAFWGAMIAISISGLWMIKQPKSASAIERQ